MRAKAKSKSAKPWFRKYWEWMNDPKVQMMSEVDQRRLDMLLCLRCSGHIDPGDEMVLFTLRISPEEWSRSKALFIEKGFLDDKNRLRNWEKRQYESDSSTERSRRSRDKKTICNGDATLHDRCGNDNATPPDTDTEEETDTETEKNISTSSAHVRVDDWENLQAGMTSAESAALINQIRPEFEAAWTSAPKTVAITTRMIINVAECASRMPTLGGIESWRGSIKRSRASPYLRREVPARNGKYFSGMTLNWFLEPDTQGNIANGLYDERQPPQPEPEDTENYNPVSLLSDGRGKS